MRSNIDGQQGQENPKVYLEDWSAVDLEFHVASQGRAGTSQKGRYRQSCPDELKQKIWFSSNSRLESLPIQKLPKPRKKRNTDISFSALIKRRKTRYVAARDITTLELSTFLSEMMAAGKPRFNGLDNRKRRYPSGGGVYESVIAILVRQLEGIADGLYFYDERKHQLRLIKPLAQLSPQLLLIPCYTLGLGQKMKNPRPPQIQVFILADIARLSWAYREIVYRTALSNASVLLYHGLLIAEAHRFAAAPMGYYPSDILADELGIKESTLPLMTQFCLLGCR